MADKKTVEFYKLERDDKPLAICQAVKRHYDQWETVAILARDKEQVDELMSRLWTFRQLDFIPHEIARSTDGIEMDRVVLTEDEADLPEADVLVLGRPCDQERFNPYDTIVDFAETHEEELRQASRERYRQLKEAGHEMKLFQAQDK